MKRLKKQLFLAVAMEEKEFIEMRAGKTRLLEDDIIEIIIRENYETTIDDVNEFNGILSELTKGKMHYVLTITQQGSSSTKEAKEYAAQESFRKNVVAQAIVISNIAIRLMATAYMRINRPKQKIKLFNSRSEALRWIQLLKIRIKDNEKK